jgi:ribosomal protein S18 acetylase RimI-like enzyme
MKSATLPSSIVSEITLRPRGVEDEDFSYQVYASTREDEMALVDWSPAQKSAFLQMQFHAQRQSYQMHFPEATYQVILRDETSVGRLILNRTVDAISLMDIALLPAYRNAGIGTHLIQTLQAEARSAGKAVRLHVEPYNPALRLYTRLGFRIVAESDFYLEMEWRPGEVKDA